jgi:hypothetical protein
LFSAIMINIVRAFMARDSSPDADPAPALIAMVGA